MNSHSDPVRNELSAWRIMQDHDQWIIATERFMPRSYDRNNIHQIGHPCPMYHFKLRTEGEKRAPFPISTLKWMKAGKECERIAKAHLMAAGYDWFEQQSPVYDQSLDLSGAHDGYIGKPGYARVPTEIKSISGNLFPSMTIERLKSGDKATRRAAFQFNAYLVKLNEPWGFFVFVNRDNYDIKVIRWDVDWEMWKESSALLKQVNKAIENKEPPARMNGGIGDMDWCGVCPFQHTCMPDMIDERHGITFIEDPYVLRNLERLEELRAAASEYEELQKWKRHYFKGMDGVSVGPYLVQGREITQNRKATPAKEITFWKLSIINTLGVKDGGQDA